MPRVLRSDLAAEDLIEIWTYIADDDEHAAGRLLARISDAAHHLAANPEMGRAREELAPLVRSFPVGRYIIFYRVLDDGIEIARVLHGSRDLPTLL